MRAHRCVGVAPRRRERGPSANTAERCSCGSGAEEGEGEGRREEKRKRNRKRKRKEKSEKGKRREKEKEQERKRESECAGADRGGRSHVGDKPLSGTGRDGDEEKGEGYSRRK